MVGVGLLDIVVIEVDDSVAVGEDFPLNSIVEDDFLLPVLVHSLNLTIMPDDLLDHLHISWVLVVIDLRELHVKVLLLVLVSVNWWVKVLRVLMRNVAGVLDTFLLMAVVVLMI